MVAEVYDLAHPVGESVGDVEYYAQALAGTRGPVLEPACGTGRVLIPLLEAGHAADGVDHSPDMLEICRSHCAERGLHPNLYASDMATFDRPNTYEAIVVPRGSIRNLDGRDETYRALRSFKSSLVPGGRLLLDVTIPLFLHEDLPIIERWRRDPFVYLCETLVVDYDAFSDRTLRYARYSKWEHGALVATELHAFCFQHWSLSAFEALLRKAGFEDVAVTGDFGVEPPKEGDRYWNFSASKPRTATAG